MSVAKILEESKSFSVQEIEKLEYELRLERLRRTGRIASVEESRLLKIVDQPFLKAERFVLLTTKWEQEGLTAEERSELLEMTSERENQNVGRVEAVRKLSEMKGVDFETLWERMIGPTPALLIPRD